MWAPEANPRRQVDARATGYAPAQYLHTPPVKHPSLMQLLHGISTGHPIAPPTGPPPGRGGVVGDDGGPGEPLGRGARPRPRQPGACTHRRTHPVDHEGRLAGGATRVPPLGRTPADAPRRRLDAPPWPPLRRRTPLRGSPPRDCPPRLPGVPRRHHGPPARPHDRSFAHRLRARGGRRGDGAVRPRPPDRTPGTSEDPPPSLDELGADLPRYCGWLGDLDDVARSVATGDAGDRALVRSLLGELPGARLADAVW